MLGLVSVAQVDWTQLHAHGRCERLDHGPLSDPRRASFQFPDDAHTRDLRSDLLKQIDPFACQAVFKLDEAGHVTAWTGQTIVKAAAARIYRLSNDNWHGASCLYQARRGRA